MPVVTDADAGETKRYNAPTDSQLFGVERGDVFSETTKHMVRRRSSGTCECAQTTCPHFGRCRLPGKDYHHKRSPDKGGVDEPANCQFLCVACHQRIHGSSGTGGVGRL